MSPSELKVAKWALSSPLHAIFFDCDGTLSLIEGIDYLAELNGVGDEVCAITRQCMTESGMSLSSYRQRLDLVRPTALHIQQLAQWYIRQVTPDAKTVIDVLQQMDKKIYLISAGIKAALLPLAKFLGITEESVFAVDVTHNRKGEYLGFNQNSDLVQPDGKSRQIRLINPTGNRCALIGDGITDLEAQSVVTRFIGYGGLGEKPIIKENADFYITSKSLLPVLALCLTTEERDFVDRKINLKIDALLGQVVYRNCSAR